MLLRQIQYFMAVVDCGSFTDAAERCYISQSAVSQQVQALEKELGASLLIREKRRFSLTPAGEYFYMRCKGLLKEVDDICYETSRIGRDAESVLRIGYLRCYSGQELYQAVADFSQVYPEVFIDIATGTHEELYNLLRHGGVDIILSDQRRAFSDDYVNYQLLSCSCYAELSARHPLSRQESVQLQDLKSVPCILISTKEQRRAELEYYEKTLNFGGSFLFAPTLEEGRLMVLGNRGFLPVERMDTLPPAHASIRRLPICQGKRQLCRTYCLFWRREHTQYYIEEFAETLRKLVRHE